MDRRVTADAFAACLKSELAVRGLVEMPESRVTLQAQLTAFTAFEQHPVGRAVRVVADDATVDLGSRVLEDERAALLHMARRTGFRLGLHELRGILGAV